MKTQTTISGSELVLGVIAIRLAVLVVAGWGLTLLPRQARNIKTTCVPSPTVWARPPQPSIKPAGPRIADAALDDMRLHD
jgi:hypothetical protein